MKLELLSPAGNLEKLNTAFYYGADAAYIGGKNFSLRAFADNFDDSELQNAVKAAKAQGKKIYVTLNIFAKNQDLGAITDYIKYLSSVGVNAVILSDPGIFALVRKVAPELDIHLSTQANTLNKYSARFWVEQGAKRIILARELSLKEIKEIRDYLPKDIELEAFCHGAMCISYSGRCLLSDYFSGRSSNRGECVQACRWNYELREKSTNGEFFPVEQDEKGTYILNSKDLNMIEYLSEMVDAGISSFKIEGRMKSEYYVATVVNAYRRALDEFIKNGEAYKKNKTFNEELLKTNHRAFTTCFALDKRTDTVNYDNSQSVGERAFIAVVKDYNDDTRRVKVEMRNRFSEGDMLELLTPFDNLNAQIAVKDLKDENGNSVFDAKIVQQTLNFYCPLKLNKGDILRK